MISYPGRLRAASGSGSQSIPRLSAKCFARASTASVTAILPDVRDCQAAAWRPAILPAPTISTHKSFMNELDCVLS